MRRFLAMAETACLTYLADWRLCRVGRSADNSMPKARCRCCRLRHMSRPAAVVRL